MLLVAVNLRTMFLMNFAKASHTKPYFGKIDFTRNTKSSIHREEEVKNNSVCQSTKLNLLSNGCKKALMIEIKKSKFKDLSHKKQT